MASWDPFWEPFRSSCTAFAVFTHPGAIVVRSKQWNAQLNEELKYIQMVRNPKTHLCDGSLLLTYNKMPYHLIHTDFDRLVAYGPRYSNEKSFLVIQKSCKLCIIAKFKHCSRPEVAAAQVDRCVQMLLSVNY
jgi:hypothetical protein